MMKVVLPFLFASVMCAIFYGTQHDKFPKDASPEKWGIFVRRVLVDILTKQNNAFGLVGSRGPYCVLRSVRTSNANAVRILSWVCSCVGLVCHL